MWNQTTFPLFLYCSCSLHIPPWDKQTLPLDTGPCFCIEHAQASEWSASWTQLCWVRPSTDASFNIFYIPAQHTPSSSSFSPPSNPPTDKKFDNLLPPQLACRPPTPFTSNTHFLLFRATSSFWDNNVFPLKRKPVFPAYSSRVFSLYLYTGWYPKTIRKLSGFCI